MLALDPFVLTRDIPRGVIGKRLRDARLRAGMTRWQAARRVDVEWRTLAAFERGKVLPPDGTVIALCRTYGVAVGWLVPERTGGAVAVKDDAVVVAGRERPLSGGGANIDEILASYLSLVYELRDADKAEEINLREADVSALATALGDTPAAIEARLIDLMQLTRREARAVRKELLKQRVVAPAAGLLMTTAAITPVLTSADRQADVPVAEAADAGASAAGAVTSEFEMVSLQDVAGVVPGEAIGSIGVPDVIDEPGPLSTVDESDGDPDPGSTGGSDEGTEDSVDDGAEDGPAVDDGPPVEPFDEGAEDSEPPVDDDGPADEDSTDAFSGPEESDVSDDADEGDADEGDAESDDAESDGADEGDADDGAEGDAESDDAVLGVAFHVVSDGTPTPDARIHVKSDTGGWVNLGWTDAQGMLSASLEPGTYSVRVHKESTKYETTVIVDPDTSFTFDIAPAGDSQSSGSANGNAGGNSSGNGNAGVQGNGNAEA